MIEPIYAKISSLVALQKGHRQSPQFDNAKGNAVRRPRSSTSRAFINSSKAIRE